jgi:hypothetical protein
MLHVWLVTAYQQVTRPQLRKLNLCVLTCGPSTNIVKTIQDIMGAY